MSPFTFQPIGTIQSCFTEKFGIPRQPGLVPEARAVLEIVPPFDKAEAFRKLEAFSHIWLIFVFHQCLAHPWKATVRPPRLGGNRR
ncbi:MAG: SAM-dependent methyltransferase, partial [Desulfobacterales bacterium]|nr:SAM-dependent methyltransferase [Desulfobacterales bacterium]